MFPFDSKAVAICKENKYAFFQNYTRIVYGEYSEQDYICKSLPGMTIEDEEELKFITNIIGNDCYKKLNNNYIEFFDPEVVDYIVVTAPLCIIHDGHFTYNNKHYTASVPSQKMLEAAESLYSVIKFCLHTKLKNYREERFYTQFFKNSLDGMSAIISSKHSADKLPIDLVVFAKRRYENATIFFVIHKKYIFIKNKPAMYYFTIPAKYYGLVLSKKQPIEKRLKAPVTLIKQE